MYANIVEINWAFWFGKKKQRECLVETYSCGKRNRKLTPFSLSVEISSKQEKIKNAHDILISVWLNNITVISKHGEFELLPLVLGTLNIRFGVS